MFNPDLPYMNDVTHVGLPRITITGNMLGKSVLSPCLPVGAGQYGSVPKCLARGELLMAPARHIAFSVKAIANVIDGVPDAEQTGPCLVAKRVTIAVDRPAVRVFVDTERDLRAETEVPVMDPRWKEPIVDFVTGIHTAATVHDTRH